MPNSSTGPRSSSSRARSSSAIVQPRTVSALFGPVRRVRKCARTRWRSLAAGTRPPVMTNAQRRLVLGGVLAARATATSTTPRRPHSCRRHRKRRRGTADHHPAWASTAAGPILSAGTTATEWPHGAVRADHRVHGVDALTAAALAESSADPGRLAPLSVDRSPRNVRWRWHLPYVDDVFMQWMLTNLNSAGGVCARSAHL
jgi:hypothetical protein